MSRLYNTLTLLSLILLLSYTQCLSDSNSTNSTNCTANCLNCSSNTTCQLCDTAFVLVEGNTSCASSCSSGQLKQNYVFNTTNNGTMCVNFTKCLSPYIADQMAGECVLNCTNGQVIYDNNTDESNKYRQCVSACPIGLFNSNGTCENCVADCQLCSNSVNCTTCNQNYVLNHTTNITCSLNCSANQYKQNLTIANTSQSECVDQMSCLSGLYASNLTWTCTSDCGTQFGINQTSSNQTYGVCVSSCPSGYFNTTNLCDSCTQFCSSCQNATVCETCETNYFKNATNTTSNCVNMSQCPSGQYADNTTWTCSASCGSQVAQNLTQNGTTYGICGSTCPNATFNSSGFCDSCGNLCDMCKNDTWCDTCQNQTYKLTNMTDNTQSCHNMTNCPLGTYADNQTWSCSTSCGSSQVALNYSAYGVCLSNCPSTYFNNSGLCSSCSADCSTCDNATVCKTCQTDFFLNTANSSYNSCVNQTSCPLGQYANNLTWTCAANCGSEVAANQTDTNNHTYGVCLQTCPLTTFNNTGFCDDCAMNCDVCLNASWCNTCSTNYYKFNSTANMSSCYAQDDCPSGYYADNTTFLCSAKCSANHYAINETSNNSTYGLCVVTCPSTYFNTSDICESCQSNCANCTSASNCFNCTQGTFNYTDSKTNVSSCVNQTSCPQGLYADNQTWTCASSCGKQYEINMTSSDNTTYGECVASCPDHYYNSSSTVCSTCNAGCSLCSNETWCDQCEADFYQVNNTVNTSSCVNMTSCPSGTYADSVSRQCSSKCGSNQYEVNQTTTDNKQYGVCLSSCPQGFFNSSTNTTLMCSTCLSGCQLCNVSSECQICTQGFVLNTTDKTCASSCGANLYELNTTQSVNSTDNKTTVYDITTCVNQTSCNQSQSVSSWLYADNTTWSCVATCSSQFEYNMTTDSSKIYGVCLKTCPSTASLGINVTQGNMTVQQCVASCPMGMVNYTSNCVTCDVPIQNCSSCSIQNNMTWAIICSACAQTMYLAPNMSTCVSNCNQIGNQYFAQTQNNVSVCKYCSDILSNCTVCQNSTVCQTCYPYNYILNSTQQCKYCDPGYELQGMQCSLFNKSVSNATNLNELQGAVISTPAANYSADLIGQVLSDVSKFSTNQTVIEQNQDSILNISKQILSITQQNNSLVNLSNFQALNNIQAQLLQLQNLTNTTVLQIASNLFNSGLQALNSSSQNKTLASAVSNSSSQLIRQAKVRLGQMVVSAMIQNPNTPQTFQVPGYTTFGFQYLNVSSNSSFTSSILGNTSTVEMDNTTLSNIMKNLQASYLRNVADNNTNQTFFVEMGSNSVNNSFESVQSDYQFQQNICYVNVYASNQLTQLNLTQQNQYNFTINCAYQNLNTANVTAAFFNQTSQNWETTGVTYNDTTGVITSTHLCQFGVYTGMKPESSSSSGLSGGAIAGIVIGCIAFVIIVGVAIYFIMKRQSTQKDMLLQGERV